MSKRRAHGSGTESIRKLTKTGTYTYYVTIPKAYIDRLRRRERQSLHAALEDDRLVVRNRAKGA